jgi:tetratricopeptide (TPR) repeat protein
MQGEAWITGRWCPQDDPIPDPDRAARILTEAVEKCPTCLDAFVWRSFVYHKVGNRRDARADALYALANGANEGWRVWVVTRSLEGEEKRVPLRHAMARPDTTSALRRALWREIVDSHGANREIDLISREVERILEEFPPEERPDFEWSLAQGLEALADFEGAERMYRRMLERRPSQELWSAIIRTLKKSGDLEGARRAYEEAAAIYQESWRSP